MRIILVALWLYSSWSSQANATARTAPHPSLSSPLSENEKKYQKFSLGIDLSAASNLRGSTDPDHQANMALSLAPSIQISSFVKLSAILGIEQKLYADQQTELTNLILNLIPEPLAIDDARFFEFSLFGVLPTNEDDRNKNSFRGGTGLTAGVSQQFSVFAQTGSLDYTLSLLKNYHEFERTNENEANLSHRIRHIISVQPEHNKKFIFELVARYQTGWTYQNALRTAFLLSEKINYAMNKTTNLYIKHINEGDALGPNGIDSNVRVYDSSRSEVSAGVSVTY